MQTDKTYRFQFLLLLVILLVCFVVNLSIGSVSIPIDEIFSVFVGNGASKESWRYILMDYRLPKAITAILAGGGLAISGLLMQTLFRNPLAGPFVLGLSSGASLGVAILILGASAFGGFFGTLLLSQWSLVTASALGSFFGAVGSFGNNFQNKGHDGDFNNWIDVRQRNDRSGFGTFLFQQCRATATIHFLVFRKFGKPVVARRFNTFNLFFGRIVIKYFQQ